MRRDQDDAISRLDRLGRGDQDDLVIVPATPYPPQAGPPTEPIQHVADDAYGATAMQPPTVVQQPYAEERIVTEQRPVVYEVPVDSVPAAAPAMVAPAPVRPERDWGPVLIAAFVALALGGLLGFLLGRADSDDSQSLTGSSVPTRDLDAADQAAVDQRIDDVLTMLLAQAEQNGGRVVVPTPYPKLDQLLALSSQTADDAAAGADATAQQVAALTTERDQLNQQVTELQQQTTDLQTQLTTAQQERDELQAALDGADNDDQAAADAATITDLQNQLRTSKQALDTSNTTLQRVQGELDAANGTLKDLGLQQIESLTGRDIGQVRTLARANGWQLIEQPADASAGAPNSVVTQAPQSGANMIRGSVLYVEVAQTR